MTRHELHSLKPPPTDSIRNPLLAEALVAKAILAWDWQLIQSSGTHNLVEKPRTSRRSSGLPFSWVTVLKRWATGVCTPSCERKFAQVTSFKPSVTYSPPGRHLVNRQWCMIS